MLKYYLGEPDSLNCMGNIYPVRIKDYEKFQSCCKLLYLSKNNFEKCDMQLMDLVFINANSINIDINTIIKQFEQLFSLVTRSDTVFKFEDSYWFEVNKMFKINKYNYDCIRRYIMQQNLMFEPKIYKNKLVQQWAEKVLATKAKNSIQISIEDMCSTVAVYKGIDPWKINEYSIYQLYTDYYRIRHFKNYDTSVSVRCIDGKTKIEDFAKEIDLLKNPYDNLFVGKDKLKNINRAFE